MEGHLTSACSCQCRRGSKQTVNQSRMEHGTLTANGLVLVPADAAPGLLDVVALEAPGEVPLC